MSVDPDTFDRPPARPLIRLAAVLVIAAVLVVLVALHTPGLNGSWYWKWPWRDTTALPATRWYGLMLLASTPVVVGATLVPRSKAGVCAHLALLMVGVFLMKLMTMLASTSPPSLELLDRIVRSPSATSYYVDAAAIDRGHPEGWLAAYPEILPLTNLHTQSKPPGAVAYYLGFIRALSYGRGSAIAAGIGLAALAALSVPAVYGLIRALRVGSEATAAAAAVLMALCPGFVLIYPTFDACYPLLACGMVVTWYRAGELDDWRWAAGFGLVLGLTTFVTYNLLVLGTLLVALSFVAVRFSDGPRPPGASIARVVKLAAVALAVTGISYLALWIATAFDPLETFRAAWRNQRALLARHAQDRPYPWTIVFDLLDFLLGAGWIMLIPAVIGVRAAFREDRRVAVIFALFLAQPVVVAIVGLLQSETARAWNFMLPLLIAPAAAELSRWPRGPRLVFYGALLGILMAIGHNMVFLVP